MTVYINASISKATNAVTAVWSDTQQFSNQESEDGQSRITTLQKVPDFNISEAVINFLLNDRFFFMGTSTLKEVAPHVKRLAYKVQSNDNSV